MKIPVIKQLVESFTLADLQQAEEALMNEQAPVIDIPGDDEGEQLTHVLAAIEIQNHMATGMAFPLALRQYTQRVRTSIN
jgi:hypothetical protein